jgi:hypothetical protein
MLKTPQSTVKILSIIVICILVVALFDSDAYFKIRAKQATGPEASDFIEPQIDFYSRRLHVGMPRQVVLSFLPLPANTNTENVCVWADASTEAVITKNHFDWQWLQATRGGYFLVFTNGRLATPLCANAAFDPWQALERYAGMSSEQTEKFFGVKTN